MSVNHDFAYISHRSVLDNAARQICEVYGLHCNGVHTLPEIKQLLMDKIVVIPDLKLWLDQASEAYQEIEC